MQCQSLVPSAWLFKAKEQNKRRGWNEKIENLLKTIDYIPYFYRNDYKEGGRGKRKPYGWQVCEEGLFELWPQPYHLRPHGESDAAGVTTRGVRPHAAVNHMVFFLCHCFIKFMYVNKILMKTRL